MRIQQEKDVWNLEIKNYEAGTTVIGKEIRFIRLNRG